MALVVDRGASGRSRGQASLVVGKRNDAGHFLLRMSDAPHRDKMRRPKVMRPFLYLFMVCLLA